MIIYKPYLLARSIIDSNFYSSRRINKRQHQTILILVLSIIGAGDEKENLNKKTTE